MKKGIILRNKKDNKYSYLMIQDDLLIFDTSEGDENYGRSSFTLQEVKNAINEYEKLNGKSRRENP